MVLEHLGYRTLAAAKEIGAIQNGLAVIRTLQANGITHVARFEDGKLSETCSLERMAEEALKVMKC